jgi:uncharacterized spore protein YtfJ
MEGSSLSKVLARLDVVKDSLTVKRVFGEPYKVDEVTVIPVAALQGGGGAGGGQGAGPDQTGSGGGAGMGFGVQARPVGVYVIRDGEVTWRPAVDVLPIVLGAQAVALAALVTIRAALSRRRRRRRR